MKKKLKKAFTLTELLVVVIVLGVLAAVAAPKFARVLETRKTAEAEEILASLRAEQEYRCVQGKAYQTDVTATQTMASAKNSKNYNYTLTGAGAAASSARGYSIQMPSYKNGQLCCEGAYCASLNKSYPSCSSLPAEDDECAADVTPEPTACATSPEGKTVQRQDCGTGYLGKKVRLWNTETCAWGDWDETECYFAEVGSCEDSTYASAHPCECEPFSCECPTYAAACVPVRKTPNRPSAARRNSTGTEPAA